MSGNYLGRAGAYAMHHNYPAGSQTSAQLAAERANLVKARQAKGEYRHTKSAKIVDKVHKFNWKARGQAADARIYRKEYVKGIKQRAVGIKYIGFEMKAHLKKGRVTGRNKKFQSRIGSSKYYGRASWGRGEASTHWHKKLRPRAHHFRHKSHWRHRSRKYSPF